MKHFLRIFICTILLLPGAVFAQETDGEETQYQAPVEYFYRGEVVEVIDAHIDDTPVGPQFSQTATIKLLGGPRAGDTMELTYIEQQVSDEPRALKSGQDVVVQRSSLAGADDYSLYQPYRIGRLWILFAIFIGVTVLAAGKKGWWSLVGLAVTVLWLLYFILPRIAAGSDPFLISVIGALLITVTTIGISHGFSKRTLVATISTIATLLLSVIVAKASVALTQLMGIGSHEAVYTNLLFPSIDMQGLLLGAIIIGALGVLDDVTTAQTATIDEIAKANSRLSIRELYRRGLSVGREHVAAVTNTLFIAYVGASLPLFILLTIPDRPLWVIINDEFIAEEIVRTLAGSITLVLAVPIATACAAYAYGKKQ